MNYNKNRGRSQSFLIQTILIFLIDILSINPIQAHINEFTSFGSLNTGDTIYVITNRTIDTTCENLSFGDEVNENSGLTFLEVTLNKSGEIVNHLLDYDAFMAQVSNKTSDWLLFVHGDGKTYHQSVKRGFNIQNYHKINVIVFSWPSRDPELDGLKNLNNSKRNVLKSMNHFNELLAFMDSFKKMNKVFNGNAKLSLLLHSLGNVYLESFAKQPATERKFNVIFDNIIINSAAVNQKKHNEWVTKIKFQKRIYITNNKFDFNLKGLHIFSKDGNQLGEKAKGPIADNAHYINFSKAVGFRFPTGLTHTYFIGNVPDESQNIRKFYFDVFHGYQIDLSNETQFKKRNHRVGYHIIFK